MLSRRLREIRINAKLSQLQLGKLANLPQTSISYWERGMAIPDVLQASRIACACGISLDELVGNDGSIESGDV